MFFGEIPCYSPWEIPAGGSSRVGKVKSGKRFSLTNAHLLGSVEALHVKYHRIFIGVLCR